MSVRLFVVLKPVPGIPGKHMPTKAIQFCLLTITKALLDKMR